MGATTTQLIEADTSTGERIPASQEAVLLGMTTLGPTRRVSE